MIPMITGTVDISKSIVRNILPEQISPNYKSELSNIEGAVRLDLPPLFSSYLGCRYECDDVWVDMLEDRLELSVLKISETQQKYKLYWFNPRRNPKYTDINPDEDSQFIVLYNSKFTVGKDVTLKMIEQTDDKERHVVIYENIDHGVTRIGKDNSS